MFILFIFHLCIGGNVEGLDPAWNELFERCFERKGLDNAKFFVKGYDEKFGRDVSLAFKVTTTGHMCSLIWEIPQLTDTSTRIIERTTGEKVTRPAHLERQTNIRILIANDIAHRTWWDLCYYFPNGFFSGTFFRSFIVKGMNQQSLKYFNSHPIPLRLTDLSDIREQYWLEKGTGKTYYEAFWNLQYDSLLHGTEFSSYATFQKISMESHDSPAFTAFIRDEPTEVIARHRSLETARLLLYEWKSLRTAEELSTMSIREVLRDFIPFWKSRVEDYSFKRQEMAQFFFEYFFKYDDNYYILKRQVTNQQPQPSCVDMSGYPIDPTPVQLNYEFYNQYYPDDEVLSEDSVSLAFVHERLSASNLIHFLHFNFFHILLSLFSFLNILHFLLQKFRSWTEVNDFAYIGFEVCSVA